MCLKVVLWLIPISHFFANHFQPGPQRARRELYLKGRVLCWETSFHWTGLFLTLIPMATSIWLNSPLQSPPNGKEQRFLEGLLLVGDGAQWSSTMALAGLVRLWSLLPDGFEMVGRKKATQTQITIIMILDVTISIDRRSVSNLLPSQSIKIHIF